MKIFDVLIIGGGPSGLSSGLYAGRNLLKTAIIEKSVIGGQMRLTKKIENYLGFVEVDTKELVEKFYNHCLEFGTNFIKDEIIRVDFTKDIKKVVGKSGEEYFSKTVIISTGTISRKLDILGVKEYLGKGISYCATCDAPFFKNMEVIVVGSGDSAIEEAMHISKFAKKVTIIVIHDENILDCNKKSGQKAMRNPKIDFLWNAELEEIKGNEYFVQSCVIKNNKTFEKFEKNVDGIFFFVGSVPKTEIFKDEIGLNRDGYIITNDCMETNIEGVFAVGDVREKNTRQVITAVSDGAIASIHAEKYIQKLNK